MGKILTSACLEPKDFLFFFPGGPQPPLKPECFQRVCLGLGGLSAPNKKDSGVGVGARHPGEGWLEFHGRCGSRAGGTRTTPRTQERRVWALP